MNVKVEEEQTFSKYIVSSFNVHNALWSCYENRSQNLSHMQDIYPISYTEDFYCAVLPSYLKPSENNLWMTNNMARSTHGTYQIQAAVSSNEIYRITWIIGKIRINEHYLKGHISTIHDKTGYLKHASIHVFYYGSSVKFYEYVNRTYCNDLSLDLSSINSDFKLDYLII